MTGFTFTNVTTKVQPTHWQLWASAVLAAGNDDGLLLSRWLLGTKAYAEYLVIDGMSGFVQTAAASGGWYAACGAPMSAPVIEYDGLKKKSTACRTDLAIIADVSANPYVAHMVLETAAALADTAQVYLWGHYLPFASLPQEPQEVTVKGVQFFPRKKVSGPV